jgi:hypothetical protein
MGVIDEIWTGKYSGGQPVMQEAHLGDYPGLDSGEWWDVSRRSKLGRAVLLSYPDCDPETDAAGRLVGIRRHRTCEDKPAPPTEALEREAAQRGYTYAGKVRPLGLMPFLRRQNRK